MKLIGSVSFFIFEIFLSGILLANTREVTASYATSPPSIDGKLDDPVWKNGVWFTDFKLISDSTISAKVQTEFQIAYDDEYFYVAARMNEPEPGCLKIEEFLVDAAVCRDDSIEFMIDPYGDRDEYFHFITNAVGIKYDARQSYGGAFHDIKWDADWKVATKISANQWTVEIAIPFAQLSLNEKSEGPWAFNIARHRFIGNKEELSSFSPMVGSFLTAQKFSKLYLPNAKLKKFFWGIKTPFDYHIEADKGDWILTGKVQVSNVGSPNEQFKLLFKQINKKGAMVLDALTDSIPVGGEKEFTFRLPVEKQEPLELQVEVVNAENVKDVFRAKKTPLNISYKPITLEVLSPSYRNYIYSDEHLNALRMRIRLALAPKILREALLQVHLLNEKADLIASMEYSPLLNTQEIIFPLKDITSGYYIIEAQIVGKNGDVIAKSNQVLRKLKYEENEWRLNANGALLCNGQSFLPKGWLDMLPDEMHLASESVYNTLFMPKEVIPDEQEAKKYLDSVSKAKGYAIIYPYSAQEMVSNKQNIIRPLSNVEIKGIQQRVKNLKKHPALMAWVIAYEPESDGVLPLRIQQVYSIIMKEDPFHPAIIVTSSIGGIKEYSGLADITMVGTASAFGSEKNATRRIDYMNYYLDVANKTADNHVSFWARFHVYSYNKKWMDSVKVATFTELRSMFYQAVICGAKGFFWNNYSYTYNYPQVRIGVQHLLKELALIEDAVLTKDKDAKVSIECVKSNAIYSSRRELGPDKYLFVVNSGSFAQNIIFNMPEWAGIGKLYVLSEKRTVSVNQDGIFSDYFEPYAVHVYTSKELDSSLPSLLEVQNAIDLENKARKKLGNLAFEDTGVTITTSSSEDLAAIKGLNDGFFKGITWRSKKDEELPQWVMLKWLHPVKLEKVLIYSDSIESAKLQVWQKDAWVDIVNFQRRSGAHFRAIFKEIEADQIRIWITEKKPGVDAVTLSEVEVYNSSTKGPEL